MIARRYPYTDGVGVLRCNACLKEWAACVCRQPAPDEPEADRRAVERAIREARRPGRRGKGTR
jgi:hypothetical protein